MTQPVIVPKPIALALLIGHTVLSAWALRDDGYFSVFPPFASGSEYQMFSDIAVACALALVWIAHDLRARGRSPWEVLAWGVGMIALGSFSPLIYWLLRPSRVAPAVQPMVQGA